MSAENVEIIRRSYERYETTGEVPFDLIDSGVEIRDFDLPDATGEVFRGHDGYMRWVEVWSTAWEDYAIELQDLVDAGDRVIAVFRLTARGKGSGVETARENSCLYTLKGGKVIRCDYFGSAEGAFEAAGVPELRSRA